MRKRYECNVCGDVKYTFGVLMSGITCDQCDNGKYCFMYEHEVEK